MSILLSRTASTVAQVLVILLASLPISAGALTSPGCQTAPALADSLTVEGRERRFIAVIPKSYRAQEPYALVFAFHGRTSPNTQVRQYYGLESHAEDAIFVYPEGLPQGQGRSWWNPGDPAAELRDYALFDTVLAWFTRHYCIDLARIFVVGHSLGASFANNLACARGDLIRGVGTLGGGVITRDCAGPVAAMVLHNPHDRLVDFSVGQTVRDLWLAENGLQDMQPVAVEPRTLNCVRYGPPGIPNPVVWCPHTRNHTARGRYYPHTWPQETGKTIMAFFASLPKTELERKTVPLEGQNLDQGAALSNRQRTRRSLNFFQQNEF